MNENIFTRRGGGCLEFSSVAKIRRGVRRMRREKNGRFDQHVAAPVCRENKKKKKKKKAAIVCLFPFETAIRCTYGVIYVFYRWNVFELIGARSRIPREPVRLPLRERKYCRFVHSLPPPPNKFLDFRKKYPSKLYKI